MDRLRKQALRLSIVAAMAAAQLVLGSMPSHAAAPCSAGTSCSPDAPDALQVTVPQGAQPCPASGLGASCVTSRGTDVAPGTASTPDGQTPCPPNAAALSSPAACSDPTATSTPTAGDPSVEPSVPVTTMRPAAAVGAIGLTSNAPAVTSGGGVVLTATAGAGEMVGGSELEIFDTTAGTLAGACGQGTQCAVAYSARSGVHVFQAFVAPSPSDRVPPKPRAISSPLSVGWVDVGLAATLTAVGPGRSTILTATATVPVEDFGYTIQLFDESQQAPLTFCSRGTNCSVSVLDAVSGTHAFAATVGPARSGPVSVTWLSVALRGTSAYRAGSLVHLQATTNVDLTGTPWSLAIVDDKGQVVGAPCKTGTWCAADVVVTSATPVFSAVVATLPQGRLVDVQARSAPMRPARLLWGVDSCKALTGDPAVDLFGNVSYHLGTPDFWGRYLTPTVCAGIGGNEVAVAHSAGMGILPIYNDYDCSNVAGYDTATGYARAAVAAAQGLQIPLGRVLAVDIEPPGPYCSGAVDAAFVQGWFDGITAAGYVPVYYGNGTAGSEFASAYCAAVSENAAIATGSYIWSFEPSLETSGFSKSNSPDWAPYVTGCPDSVAAWQFQIDVSSPNPNVDLDEALSTLPLWYP